mmetsp:Transcript_32268/g.61747  ORF Transcript_32268/g.61747 Transcript_32268/m.61747 type:complete len:245 (-) Transcript_32268:1354-2088(-)
MGSWAEEDSEDRGGADGIGFVGDFLILGGDVDWIRFCCYFFGCFVFVGFIFYHAFVVNFLFPTRLTFLVITIFFFSSSSSSSSKVGHISPMKLPRRCKTMTFCLFTPDSSSLPFVEIPSLPLSKNTNNSKCKRIISNSRSRDVCNNSFNSKSSSSKRRGRRRVRDSAKGNTITTQMMTSMTMISFLIIPRRLIGSIPYLPAHPCPRWHPSTSNPWICPPSGTFPSTKVPTLSVVKAVGEITTSP